MRSGRGLFREAALAHLVTEGEEANVPNITENTWQFLLCLLLLKLKTKACYPGPKYLPIF